MSRKLFIGGLGRTTQPREVAIRLGRYGEVEDVRLVTDTETGMSLGFGFVTFTTATDAAHALREASGIGVDGHEIRLAGPGSYTVTGGR